jgi:hypothetical protein
MLSNSLPLYGLSGPIFKELRMTAQDLNPPALGNVSEKPSEKISLEVLAQMTGFPLELIKQEVLKGHNSQELSLEELRSAMLSYIDSTMLLV